MTYYVSNDRLTHMANNPLPPQKRTKFRLALEANNIALRDLAEVSKIPYPYLYNLYMGYDRANPKLDRIQILLDSLQCKFEEIF